MTEIKRQHVNFSQFNIKGNCVSKNPGSLAQKALNLYNDYILHKSKTLKTLFLEDVNSLITRLVSKEDFSIWTYNYLSPRAKMYGCRSPWVSALAQGLGISALVRAYSLTENKRYLEIALHALNAFKFPIKEGGVLYIDKDDNDWWYEEYAHPHGIPSGVLNGFVFALLGIYDFHTTVNDDESQELFDQGVQTLCHHLPDFDVDYPFKLSYYDRLQHIVTIKYHRLHIKLLEILHEITKQSIFRKYQQKWEDYKNQWYDHQNYRWLWTIYYVKSGYNPKDSIKLSARLIFKEKKFITSAS